MTIPAPKMSHLYLVRNAVHSPWDWAHCQLKKKKKKKSSKEDMEVGENGGGENGG